MTGWTGTLRTWATGDALNATNLNANVRDPMRAVTDSWTTYTPTWDATTTSPALNNGTLSGAYSQAGKLIHFWITLTCGSSTTYGAGNYVLTLPVVPRVTGFLVPSLIMRIRDTVGGLWLGSPYYVNPANGQVQLGVYAGAAGGKLTNVTPTVPTTFANGVIMTLDGTYEAA